ncbi:HIT domain-containing protein [Azoarcus indigens]|uniref:Diadenosine tetraphosphate (Ap4A) HIT family hydrolase n=1 Tax=Azoarcus indigens TaxID=29545 RepID=A0A4R6DPY6_9RHOO|nr:HIT family protein [Azoarcus indigens]NMG66839.1 HIT domain-containing protein [Azoarcus indigens]TDN47007.1 diadenosine tetraphosphate (Ap4A) HIT family hydrolase [Azoarcus indigens]
MACPLCRADDETVLWHDDRCRVIQVGDAAHPGFCRVIWHEHVAEMSDLPAADRQHLMDVVLATEQALRAEMRPDKINLASFGNMVPHLHWHVIPRYSDDRHFPESVWGPAQRDGVVHPAPDSAILSGAIGRALSALTRR